MKFSGYIHFTKRVVLCQEYDEELQTSDQVHEALRGGHAFKPMETCWKSSRKGDGRWLRILAYFLVGGKIGDYKFYNVGCDFSGEGGSLFVIRQHG